MNIPKNMESFKKALDDNYSWPTTYTFKFISPPDKVNELTNLIAKDLEITKRPSKTGKYLSLTFSKKINSTDEVIDIYLKAGTLAGVISL